jgi:hypothetical protein
MRGTSFTGGESWIDAVYKCERCGLAMVEVDTLAERLVRHFGLEGQEAEAKHEKLQSKLMDSGIEAADGVMVVGFAAVVAIV